ncbi:glucosyltransferase-I [Apilactobacillus kunkeei EFB6]|uniref:dextransucrase n=1 Tax=Apilactobacillus kunkeei EFB6 TaxID=1419324 RepID=A0A837AZZ0_9LACO|nr:glycoside hydrolase family 70 protein [Apilactobacillus kunkeei]KDB00249.1 glucosyltransferase-I [Apilactobacillus kunkeei EFB6]
MNNNQEKKLHYKMYKSGKQWIVAGILSATMSVVFAEHVDNPTVSAKADQNNVTYTGSYASSNSDNGKSAYSASSYISGTGSLPDSAKSSIASSASSSNSVSSSAASLSSSSQTDTSSSSSKNSEQSVSSSSSSQNESSQASNSSESSSVSASSSQASNSSQSSNASDSSAQSSFAPVSLSVQLASNASDSLKAHTKEIDGKTYFYDSNNNQVKSALMEDNGTYYYFGPDGYLTTFNDSKFSDGSINSSDHLSIYTPDGKSITNVDGFLTADSWYRPKQIQVSDTQWRNSTDADFRPLLSVWWPNKTIEINYLNYMSKNGLVSGHFDNNSSANDINQAAATVRLSIENKIKADNGDLSEIKSLFTTFVNSQDEWNVNSEDYNVSDGFQGGNVAYGNNSQTINANSDYRLFGRTPSKQDGKVDYKESNYYGYEFLLGNDVDNSNPTVQAETLNWLYYLMNFGSITQKDPNGNFDSVRVDAVDNMDADILNIIGEYFKSAYKINENDSNSNNHISILEDWSKNDAYYEKNHGTNQMTIDGDYLGALQADLMSSPSNRYDLSSLITSGVVDRTNDDTENTNIPNYSIVRAHDNGVQSIISNIVIDKIAPNSTGLNPTLDQISKAFEIYNSDENSTDKKYTQYNIPASYALILTNKDTTPRVYYGDMYTDNGQFMANKSPYYDSISSMLNARIKYVSGGQSMNAVKVDNGFDTILTSVRYGKGALKSTDVGDDITRTSGIAVIESNNPNLKLSSTDKVVVHMGAAHKNQEYRQLLTATDSGIATFDSDSSNGYVLARTDDNGDLTLDGSVIKGYANPQVSGYLSMWVPLGASDSQDIRTDPSTTPTTDGQSLHSNSASDSNVIFEAFSNFQDFAKTTDQYENVVIQKNADQFKQLGFTYVELPPQYRSTTDGTFLDSTVQNGYAFNDRYDLGFGTPTKYGTAEQLTDAIKSLHAQGIKVIADFVPDQLYSLPNQQIVDASRVDPQGTLESTNSFTNVLYDTFSKSSGTDYQAKYGGEFLDKLKELYPDLFTIKQISTGQPIDASTKIKTWTAQYLNGSNIQGRGSQFVLSNLGNSGYFTVTTNDNSNISSSFLPKQLYGENVQYGLRNINGEIKYISTSGYVPTNAFLEDDNGNWYYIGADGNFVKSPEKINGVNYYFVSNGVNLRDFIYRDPDGKMYYYQSNGAMATIAGYYYSNNMGHELYINKDGTVHTGLLINGDNEQYYDANGYQVKGDIVVINGKRKYFEPTLGNMVKKGYVCYENNWYYADKNGDFVTGIQKIGTDYSYFNSEGIQEKNTFALRNGKMVYFDNDLGNMARDTFINRNGKIYYADDNGYLLKGYQDINGTKVFFNDDYTQLKDVIENVNGKLMYFDGGYGHAYTGGFFEKNGNYYYALSDGTLATGSIDIDGYGYYFDENGIQVKGKIISFKDGTQKYYEASLGHLVVSQQEVIDGHKYRSDAEGNLELIDSNSNNSSSENQSSASSHEAQSSSSAQSSALSHEAQTNSSAQSSASSHAVQSSSNAQSSASSHEVQSSSSAQSSASSHEVQSNSSAQSSALSHESQSSSSAQSSASSHGEQGKTSAHENVNGVSQNKPSQSHANDDSDKVLSNRELTTNNQVSNDHSVNNQTTQHVSNVNTLSRTKTRENQKIQSKMLTTKSLKQVNKQASSLEKLVKKELKQLDKLKAELKKHSSKKLKKEYNAFLQKYKANKKYYLALVAEQNTVEKYLKSAKNLKKDQKALNSLNKKLAKDKKELKRHSSKKLKKTYEKDIKGKKKLTKAIKKYKGDEAKLKKSIVNNFKKASSLKSEKK